MKPIDFPQSNKTFLPPKGMDNCMPLKVFHDSGKGHYISCWKLSIRDVLQCIVNRTVWLHVAGQGHPPVRIDPENPFKGAAR